MAPGLSRLLPELAAGQPDPLAGDGDMELARIQLFDAVRNLLVHMAEAVPLLLVLVSGFFVAPESTGLGDPGGLAAGARGRAR